MLEILAHKKKKRKKLTFSSIMERPNIKYYVNLQIGKKEENKNIEYTSYDYFAHNIEELSICAKEIKNTFNQVYIPENTNEKKVITYYSNNLDRVQASDLFVLTQISESKQNKLNIEKYITIYETNKEFLTKEIEKIINTFIHRLKSRNEIDYDNVPYIKIEYPYPIRDIKYVTRVQLIRREAPDSFYQTMHTYNYKNEDEFINKLWILKKHMWRFAFRQIDSNKVYEVLNNYIMVDEKEYENKTHVENSDDLIKIEKYDENDTQYKPKNTMSMNDLVFLKYDEAAVVLQLYKIMPEENYTKHYLSINIYKNTKNLPLIETKIVEQMKINLDNNKYQMRTPIEFLNQEIV